MLIVRNLTNLDITLSTVGVIVPASPISGVRGVPVNVTSEIRPSLTVDPTLGTPGGLESADYATLQAQVATSEVCYEWTSIPEYNTDSLQVLIPNQLTKYIVGKDPGDPYDSIKTAADAANAVSTSTVGAIIYVKPGVYDEPDLITIGLNVAVQALVAYEEYPEDDGDLTVTVNGKFEVTGASSKIKGIQVNSTGAGPSVNVNASNFVISDCYFKEHPSSDALINVQSGSCSVISSNVASSGLVSAVTSNTGFSIYNSVVGADPSSPLVANSVSGTVTLFGCTVNGGMTLNGTGAITIATTHIILDGTTVAGNKKLWIKDATVSQIDPSVPKSLVGPWLVDTRIEGFLAEGEFSNSSTSSVYLPELNPRPVFVSKLNCDNLMVVKNDAGSVNLDTQNKNCVINKTVADSTEVVLPPSPLLGEEHVVVDGKGDANINNITVNGNGNTINGNPSYVITSPFGNVKVIYNGSEWSIIP